MTKQEVLEYWIERKEAYTRNLQNGIGNKQSIEKLIYEIDKKITYIINGRNM